MSVTATESASGAPPPAKAGVAAPSTADGVAADGVAADGTAAGPDRAQELKDRALADNSVQTMLDVFAAEIKDVEEM
jgi:hypothetical protein